LQIGITSRKNSTRGENRNGSGSEKIAESPMEESPLVSGLEDRSTGLRPMQAI